MLCYQYRNYSAARNNWVAVFCRLDCVHAVSVATGYSIRVSTQSYGLLHMG